MTSVSISQLKTNPAKAISESMDFPLPIMKRNKTQAYLIGKDLFEKMVVLIENVIDKEGIETTDLSKKRNFEEVAQELGI